MDVIEKIQEIMQKTVEEREEWEHQFLIKMKYLGSVREYLLSMGAFEDVPLE